MKMPICTFLLICLTLLAFSAFGQQRNDPSFSADGKGTTTETSTRKPTKAKVLYGTASYYADKFNGRKTANGQTYSHDKLTAACNVLPLGTWIRVTNLRNNKSVIVQVNDRLHPKNKRIVDMSKIGAQKLGYVKRGLTQVKVEVLGRAKKRG
jgi:rare lipoprotein A